MALSFGDLFAGGTTDKKSLRAYVRSRYLGHDGGGNSPPPQSVASDVSSIFAGITPELAQRLSDRMSESDNETMKGGIGLDLLGQALTRGSGLAGPATNTNPLSFTKDGIYDPTGKFGRAIAGANLSSVLENPFVKGARFALAGSPIGMITGPVGKALDVGSLAAVRNYTDPNRGLTFSDVVRSFLPSFMGGIDAAGEWGKFTMNEPALEYNAALKALADQTITRTRLAPPTSLVPPRTVLTMAQVLAPSLPPIEAWPGANRDFYISQASPTEVADSWNAAYPDNPISGGNEVSGGGGWSQG